MHENLEKLTSVDSISFFIVQPNFVFIFHTVTDLMRVDLRSDGSDCNSVLHSKATSAIYFICLAKFCIFFYEFLYDGIWIHCYKV
jgi:hypothetical protein